jgi:sensor c-di-GMP phosphodiesterase-like protein
MITAMITVDDLREGMDRGELFVEYLPIVSLRDERCVGAEALVRWWHDGSVLYPSNFIPIAENTPLSGAITYWVIDTVASELGAWLAEHAEAQISINVPPEILGRGGIEYAARRSGLRARADQIVLEITERGIPDRLGLAALNELADRGVRVALDDTTLSAVNLAVLTRCNFSVVKIDRSLTAQLRPDEPVPEWFDGLAALLRSSTLEVIAEGIETSHQAERLRDAGVELGQGFWFSLPLSARGLKEFYNAHDAY